MKSIATPFVAQDASLIDDGPTLIGTAAFWPPSSSEDDASLELVPLIQWLADSIRPGSTVCRLPTAGSAWNAHCEVLRRLDIGGRCLLVLPPTEQDDQVAAMRRGRAARRCRSLDSGFASLVSWDKPSRPAFVPAGSVDLLYLDGLDTSPWSDEAVQDDWIAGLGPQGMLAIDGIRSSGAAARLFERLRQRHPHHAFQIGQGLGLVGAGSQVPSVFRRLLSAPGSPSGPTGIDHAFARLGQAALDAAFIDRLHEKGTEGANLRSNGNASSISRAQARERDTVHRLAIEQAHASRRHADATADALRLQRQLGEEQLRHHVAQERLRGVERELELVTAQRDDATWRLGNVDKALDAQLRIHDDLSADNAAARTARLLAEQSVAVRFTEIAFLTRRVLELESQSQKAAVQAAVSAVETAGTANAAPGGGPTAVAGAGPSPTSAAPKTARPLPPARRPPPRGLGARLRRRLARLLGRPHDKSLANAIRLVREAKAFDEDWYVARYPDVARFTDGVPLIHFLRFGAIELRDPSPRFSMRAYVEMYPDVAESGINPLLHYLKFGQYEERLVRPVRA